MTEPEPDQEPGRTRPFADVLVELNRGRTHAELSSALQQLIGAVRDTGKRGQLTLTLTVRPARAEGMVEVVDGIAVKAPAYDRATSMFFVDDEANLSRTDPRQAEIPGLLRDITREAANR